MRRKSADSTAPASALAGAVLSALFLRNRACDARVLRDSPRLSAWVRGVRLGRECGRRLDAEHAARARAAADERGAPTEAGPSTAGRGTGRWDALSEWGGT
ncbi:hypothetical protein CF645_37595, partial [Burkholderia pseudomallei]